jgi:hypothetical protein
VDPGGDTGRVVKASSRDHLSDLSLTMEVGEAIPLVFVVIPVKAGIHVRIITYLSINATNSVRIVILMKRKIHESKSCIIKAQTMQTPPGWIPAGVYTECNECNGMNIINSC